MIRPCVTEYKDDYSLQGVYSPLGIHVTKQIIPSHKERYTDGVVCNKGLGNPRRSLVQILRSEK